MSLEEAKKIYTKMNQLLNNTLNAAGATAKSDLPEAIRSLDIAIQVHDKMMDIAYKEYSASDNKDLNALKKQRKDVFGEVRALKTQCERELEQATSSKARDSQEKEIHEALSQLLTTMKTNIEKAGLFKESGELNKGLDLLASNITLHKEVMAETALKFKGKSTVIDRIKNGISQTLKQTKDLQRKWKEENRLTHPPIKPPIDEEKNNRDAEEAQKRAQEEAQKRAQEEAKQIETQQNAFAKIKGPFEKALNELEVKVKELEGKSGKKYVNAATVARTLHTALKHHAEIGFANSAIIGSFRTFKEGCNAAIGGAKQMGVLEQHRGFGDILNGIIKIINTVIYGLTLGHKSGFFKEKQTDSATKVNKLEKAIVSDEEESDKEQEGPTRSRRK